MMVGMAINVCFTPFGQPIVDERLLLIPYFITAVTTTCLRLIMVNEYATTCAVPYPSQTKTNYC